MFVVNEFITKVFVVLLYLTFIWSPSLNPCSTKSNGSPLCNVELGVNVPSDPDTVMAPFKVILADIFSPANISFIEVALA